MTRLWFILGVSLLIAVLIDYRDKSLAARGYAHRDRVFTGCLIVILGFFCGLRTWGNDTAEYVQGYIHLTPTFETYDSKIHAPEFSTGWLFFYVNVALKSWGFTKQDFLMFYAFATVVPYLLFLRRFSCSMVWGVFMMFATGFYTFSMAAIKQSLAVGVCLISLSFALDRKWFFFFLTVLTASLFHPYALIYLITPLMIFRPWRGKTILYVLIFVSAGFMLESLIGTVLDITTLMGASYSESDMLGAGVNLFRVAVSFVPMGLAIFYGGELFKETGDDIHLMFNLAMINALIMFVGIFGTANYFARLANYFLPAQAIIIPWMIMSAHPQDRRWLISACLVGYTGYFYYEHGIIRPFDATYSQMTVWEYLQDLLSR